MTRFPSLPPHNPQCGAITEYMRVPRPPRPKTLFRLLMLALSQLKWVVVVGVLLLIASIIIPGALVVLPQVWNLNRTLDETWWDSIPCGNSFLPTTELAYLIRDPLL